MSSSPISATVKGATNSWRTTSTQLARTSSHSTVTAWYVFPFIRNGVCTDFSMQLPHPLRSGAATDSPIANDMDDGRLRLGLRHRQATRGTRVGFTSAGSECATQQALAIRWERAALHDVKLAPPAPVLAFRRRDTTSLRDVLRLRRATPATTSTATWGVRAGPYPAAADCATHQALAIRWERATLRALGSDAFRVGRHALKA